MFEIEKIPGGANTVLNRQLEAKFEILSMRSEPATLYFVTYDMLLKHGDCGVLTLLFFVCDVC